MRKHVLLTPLVLAATACATAESIPSTQHSFFDLVSSQPIEEVDATEPVTPAWNPPHVLVKNVRGHKHATFRYEEDDVYDIDVGPPGTIVTLRFGKDEVVEPKATSGDAGEVPATGGATPSQAALSTGWGVVVRKAGGRSIASIAVGDDALDETTLVFFSDQRAYQINARRLPPGRSKNRMQVVSWNYPPRPMRPRTRLASRCSIDTASVNVDYSIEADGKSLPVWSPVAVGTNGRKTWLGYAGDIGAIGPAPLFVTDGGRTMAGLTPRRCGQRFLEYDGTFATAEMRRGQEVVKLSRLDR